MGNPSPMDAGKTAGRLPALQAVYAKKRKTEVFKRSAQQHLSFSLFRFSFWTCYTELH